MTDIYLLKPLLLDLEAYLILDLTRLPCYSYSSSISPRLLPLISAKDLVLLLLLILYSTKDASRPCYSRTSLN